MRVIFLDRQKVFPKFSYLVAAIGVFDGVHRGHQRLIRNAVIRARKMSGTAAVMTFFPHPVHVLYHKHAVSLLVSLEHRLRLIEDLGADVCIVMPFTKVFAKLSAESFVSQFLVKKIGAKEIFIGRNFHFGKDRIGNSIALRSIARDYSIRTNILNSICYRRDVVSSSRLRRLVQSGDLALAEKYLGRKVSLVGRVIRGDQRGQKFGIPTANINCGPEILPPLGVYIVRVQVACRSYRGVANIGYRPSFTTSQKKNIEVHLFDFQKKIYGKKIEVQLLKKIRNEKRFRSPHDFIAQFQKDKSTALEFFRKNQSL